MEILKRELEEKAKPKNKFRLLIVFLFALLMLIAFVAYREIKIFNDCKGVVNAMGKAIPKEKSDIKFKIHFPEESYLVEEGYFYNYYRYTCSVKSKSIVGISKYYYNKLKSKFKINFRKEKIAVLDVTDEIKMSYWNIQSRTIVQEDSEFIVVLGGGNDDTGVSVKQIEDGYLVVGSTNSYGEGSNDIFIAKFNESGNLKWAKTAGGKNDDFAHSVQLTDDGGYVITGYTTSYGSGGYDILVMKYDKKDNLEWAKTAGGNKKERSFSIQQTQDQGYVVAGITESYGAGAMDSMVLKFDESGNLEWTKVFGGMEHDFITSIDQTKDNKYIIVGYTRSYGNFGKWDDLLVKLNESGGLEWAKVTGENKNDQALSVEETMDNQYIVMGCSKSYSFGDEKTKFDVLLIKYDQEGNVLWSKTVGRDDDEYPFLVSQTQDQGYAVIGYDMDYKKGISDIDIFLFKYDESGKFSWARAIGDSGKEKAYSIQETQDKAYITTGSTTSYGSSNRDVLLVKVKPEESSISDIIMPRASSFPIGNEKIDLPITTLQ